MSDNGVSHGFDIGFDHNNGDSDNSQGGGDPNTGKVCRDFMRNVCNRKNCKFIHPENIKIRTEPIFCHDYQQNKCFRSTCKFIHCTREDEDHYKLTGELPVGASGTEYYEARPVRGGGTGNKPNNTGRKPSRLNSNQQGGGRNGFNSRRNGGDMDGGNDSSEIPICKDNLKGLCDRPRGGCRFRHVNPSSEPSSYGGLGGQSQINRRRGGSQNYYDSGPESKRNHYSTDYGTDYSIPQNTYSPPPPPPPPQSTYPTSTSSSSYTTYHDPSAGSHVHGLTTPQNQNPSSAATSLFNAGGTNRNGFNVSQSQLNDMSTAMTSFMATPNNNVTAAAMKALEDENFMLKRRIEELKKQVSDLVATNEYLLSQNAHFRINNMTKEVQSASGPAGVVQMAVSMAQPIGLSPSLSVAATQPLSTITSMSIPTVSMTPVSISQPQNLPVVSMSHHPSQTSQAMLSQPQVYPLVTTQVGNPGMASLNTRSLEGNTFSNFTPSIG